MSSQSSGTSRAEPLARCWARETHSSEYWPAELLAITPDGEYQVAFCGWGESHNLVLPATAADGTPSVLFQQPARPRKGIEARYPCRLPRFLPERVRHDAGPMRKTLLAAIVCVNRYFLVSI